MSNRNLYYLSIIAVILIGLLFLVDLRHIFQYSSPYPEIYLKHNEVSGISVQYQGKLYTLNFEQQNDIIDIINRSLPVVKAEGVDEKANFEKIVIYTFGKSPDIQITPLGYDNNDLIYSAPLLVPKGYLMEVSNGKLKKIVQAILPSNTL